MPVQRATTAAMSSSSTSSLTSRLAPRRRRAPRAPARARAARRSGSRRRAGGRRARSARSASMRSSSICRCDLVDALERPPSRATSAPRARRAPPWPRRAPARRGSRTSFVSFAIAASSISSWRTRRSASSSSSGSESISMRSREAASSTRSIALSGRAVGDVAVGEHGRGDERGVADADAVVRLVALLQAAQDRDRVLDRRLADEDRLEAALERGVLLDVLAVLVERRRADRSAARRARASA